MKNKKLFGVISLLLATGLILAGCIKGKDKSETSSSSSQTSSSLLSSDTSTISSSESQSSDPSSESSSESSSETTKYTVTLKVGDDVIYTEEVEEGGLVSYSGTPSKAGDAESPKYRFTGWDKDITAPITEDTVFTAQFASYAAEYKVGDFEEFESNSELADEGWYTLGYSSTGWTKDTKASLSIGRRATEGNQSLRFDAWANNNDYKLARDLPTKEYTKSVNALKFSLMVPKITTVKVLLQGSVTADGKTTSAYFSIKLDVISEEYVDYVIPFDDPNWALWGEAGKSMVEVADWVGFHQDDILPHLTSIEFYFRANDGIGGQKYIAFLDDISFVTLDNPEATKTESLGYYSTYTGLTTSDNTVKLDINNDGTAVASVITLETPLNVNGKITITDNQLAFVSDDEGETLTYVGKLINGGQRIEFLSASGTLKSEVTDMTLNAVQKVEDFEEYDSAGLAYYSGNLDITKKSGLRGAFFSEYFKGSGQSEWGGTGWSLMEGDGDQIDLKKDGGHTGNNYASFKHSKDFGMRYIQWGLFDSSSEINSFRGSKLSFWAKTNGLVEKFKVSMYSQTAPRNATKDNQVKSLVVSANAQIDDWKHYEIDLNPSLVYYGFLVFMDKNYDLGSNATYLYLDDFEVYTDSPYARFVPKSELKVPVGMTYIGKVKGGINSMIEIIDETTATYTIPGLELTRTGTYTFSGDTATFNFENGTTYVATLSEDAKSLTCVSVSGTDEAIVSRLTGLNFNMVDYAENAESYENDGTMYYQGNTDEELISGARGAYHCEYYLEGASIPSIIGGVNWSLMGGDGDQIQLDSTTKVDGRQSLKFQYGSVNMRYIQWGLAKGTAKPHTGNNKFAIYLKNTNEVDIKIRLCVFKLQKIDASSVNTARADREITIPASSDWALYTMDLSASETYYGYGIIMPTMSESGFIHVDKAYYYHDADSPDVDFVIPNGLSLTGTFSDVGEATFNFTGKGTLKFTCAAISKNNAGGSYKLEKVGEDVRITMVIGFGTIVATYSINSNNEVTLTVISTGGNLASSLPAGDAFTGTLK